jgi:cell division protein FtsW (lipid II flippase)
MMLFDKCPVWGIFYFFACPILSIFVIFVNHDGQKFKFLSITFYFIRKYQKNRVK